MSPTLFEASTHTWRATADWMPLLGGSAGTFPAPRNVIRSVNDGDQPIMVDKVKKLGMVTKNGWTPVVNDA